ncbi:hypothetical protein B566_EDAN007350 [Ephemera danica]|nr:hypothetical protein B566_EDAN007350 [Ephemera danica]
MNSEPSTSGTSRHRSKSRKQQRRTHQVEDDQEDDANEDSTGTFEAEPGFIEKATVHGKNFLNIYRTLVKIYPDRKKNFDINITKLLELYLNSVLTDTPLEDPHALALLDFAKAGLLVQGSTNIYSKKVEFLVDLLAQLLGFVESGVTSDESADPQAPGGRKNAAAHKDNSFSAVELKFNKSKHKVSERRGGGDKKLTFRPMCFPVLMRQDQGDVDKKHITTLNPSFTGDKTAFRLWGPANGEQGLLVADLAAIKFKADTKNIEPMEEDAGSWEDAGHTSDNDIGADNENNDDFNNHEADIEMAVPQEAAPPEHPPLIADASDVIHNVHNVTNATQAEENKENSPENVHWNDMRHDNFVENVEIEPRIKLRPIKVPAVMVIQDAFIKNLNNNTENIGKLRYCFGPNRVIPPLVPDLDLFAENPSDSEDVVGFDEDGGIVYVSAQKEVTNMPAPTIDMDDWHEADADETVMFHDPDALPEPEPSTSAENPIELAPLPQIEDDNDLAQRLENWFKKINRLQEIESKKPQFTFHSYCTEVLQRFPPNEDRISFKSIAEGKRAGQIARYLLATLQLVSTNL